MKINPKTEDEINKLGILQEGIYNFEVLDAFETTSKAGNEMIKIIIRIKDKSYKTYNIYDYLLNTETREMEFKIKHFFESIGMIEMYNSGEIECEKILDKIGKAKIIIKRDKNNLYPDKNIVLDYIKNENNLNFINNDFLNEDPF